MNPALIASATLNHTVLDILYWINPAKANKAGKVPVSMRITARGQRTEISTGVRCLPVEWNRATKRLQSVEWNAKKQAHTVLREPLPATVHLNQLLDALEAKTRLLGADMRQAQAATRPLILQELRHKLLGEVDLGPDIFDSLTKLLDLYPNPNTRATHSRAIKQLRFFLPTPAKLYVFDLGPALGTKFKAWASKTLGEAGARIVLASLHRLFNRLHLGIPNPFANLIESHRQLQKPRYVLSFEELDQLRNLVLEAGSAQAVARDIYLTQYYLHGSRVGVVLELTWGQVDWQNGRVRFKAEKGGDWHNVAMQPELATILRRYAGQHGPMVFPLLPADYLTRAVAARHPLRKQALSKIWKALQEVGELLALPGRLHSHTARHTLATHTVQITGNMRLAQKLLGHSDLSMTENYVRSMLSTELDAGAAAVYTRGRALPPPLPPHESGRVVPMWTELTPGRKEVASA